MTTKDYPENVISNVIFDLQMALDFPENYPPQKTIAECLKALKRLELEDIIEMQGNPPQVASNLKSVASGLQDVIENLKHD